MANQPITRFGRGNRAWLRCTRLLVPMLLCSSGLGGEPTTELLWPNGAPGAKGSSPGDQPSLTYFLPPDRKTPPTFLIHGETDPAVPVENSLAFYTALRKAGVSAELHVFRQGRHGFGLGAKDGEVSAWPRLCEQWMRTMGFVEGLDGILGTGR